jgi:hypothetical protein
VGEDPQGWQRNPGNDQKVKEIMKRIVLGLLIVAVLCIAQSFPMTHDQAVHAAAYWEGWQAGYIAATCKTPTACAAMDEVLNQAIRSGSLTADPIAMARAAALK